MCSVTCDGCDIDCHLSKYTVGALKNVEKSAIYYKNFVLKISLITGK